MSRLRNSILLCLSGFLLILFLYGIYLWISYKNGYEWSILGQVGDSFGALNVIFSGFALVGVIFTLWLQYKQTQEIRRTTAMANMPFIVLEDLQVKFENSIDKFCNGNDFALKLLISFKNRNYSDVPAFDVVTSISFTIDVNNVLYQYTVPNSFIGPKPDKGVDNEYSLFLNLDQSIKFFEIFNCKNSLSFELKWMFRNLADLCYQMLGGVLFKHNRLL